MYGGRVYESICEQNGNTGRAPEIGLVQHRTAAHTRTLDLATTMTTCPARSQSRPKLNKTCVARGGQGMLLGDDDAMAAHFDPQVNFYSKSAKSISYGELYGIPTQEFISRA